MFLELMCVKLFECCSLLLYKKMVMHFVELGYIKAKLCLDPDRAGVCEFFLKVCEDYL